jgi:hypothetical protein
LKSCIDFQPESLAHSEVLQNLGTGISTGQNREISS